MAPGGFEVFIHILMAKMEDIFNFFWYLYIPVPVAEGMTILIKLRHDLLAIMGDEMKFTMAPSVILTGCHNTGVHGLQHLPDAQSSRSEDACLFELYHCDMQGVRQHARRSSGPPGMPCLWCPRACTSSPTVTRTRESSPAQTAAPAASMPVHLPWSSFNLGARPNR
jgi:hypothetical protein